VPPFWWCAEFGEGEWTGSDPMHEAGRVLVASSRMESWPELQSTSSEYTVNLEVLNGYVLAGIAILALCLYVAVITTGLAELMPGAPKFHARRKRWKGQRATRRRRDAGRLHPWK
jgi:hypothetical protein